MCICITYFFFIFYIFICHSICFPSFLFMSVRPLQRCLFLYHFQNCDFYTSTSSKKVDIKMILSKYGLIPSFYCVYNLHFSDTFLDNFFFFTRIYLIFVYVTTNCTCVFCAIVIYFIMCRFSLLT